MNNFSIALLTLPLITGLIGWATNYIAIKMLFHPRQPVKLWFITLHGILPRRQPDIAMQLGRIVATDLLSSEDLITQLTNERSRLIYNAFIDIESERFIRNQLRQIAPISRILLRSKVLAKIKSSFADEVIQHLPILIEQLTIPEGGALDVQKLVEDRVRAFSTDRLEKILYDILAKEFRFIELLGGVLGFLIGLVQLAFILLTS